ncbi:MAG: hypothetical protein K2M03_05035 [Muribaculaceae bacterium]|nr:hypothetical protein [Muribaculaceae bacterium]MDE6295411.1 hypothetical protein [Muribaculaceae bacterium]
MELPFPHIAEHKKYPATFLINVEWRIHFSIATSDTSYTNFFRFVKDKLDLELKREDFNAMAILPLRYNQSEDAACIKISDKFAEFSFNANGYTSFADSARDIITSFLRLIYQCDGTVSHLMCNKKNLVTMQRNFECVEPEILSVALSEQLLDSPAEILRPADFTSDATPSTHFYTLTADGMIMRVLYGAYARLESTEYNGMTMREYGVMLESQCDVETKIDNAAECIRRVEYINDTMFDFINWALSPRILRLMEIEIQDGIPEINITEIEDNE